ncbi:MAG: hypothetical protein ABEI86_07980, partial [Halobacteriaceae archaeon]
FASYVVPRHGENEDHKLPIGGRPVLKLTEEWEVIGTTRHGYPAVLRTKEDEGIVTATLNTVGKNKKYHSAILGYDPDFGSFGLATFFNRDKISSLFGGDVIYYEDDSDFEDLSSVLTNFNYTRPIVVDLENGA